MITKHQNKVLIEAITKYGIIAQEEKAVEELTELSLSLQHRKKGKCSVEDVIDEIADVIIMCEQLKIIYNSYKVEKQIQFKINRLNELLK